MSQDISDWPRERRAVPEALRAHAASSPGGSVAEIDGSQISDAEGFVPTEAIVGVWAIGPEGQLTGEFSRNPRHDTVSDDFSRLTAPDHWLGWLPDEPAAAVRASIERIIAEQVPGSGVPWIKVIEDPVFLTGGARHPDDPERMVVRRAALAMPFALGATPPGEPVAVLTGVFTWVASGLDAGPDRRDRVWFDLGMTREEAAQLVRDRIHELDEG